MEGKLGKQETNIIIEKLSHIEFEVKENSYTLWDIIRDQKYQINKTTYEICSEINGSNTLEEITEIISKKYATNYQNIVDDVYEIYLFLQRNKLIICKNTFKYDFFKLYNKLARIH